MHLQYWAQQSEAQPDGTRMQCEIGANGLCLSERVDGELAVGEAASPPAAMLRPHRVRGNTVAVLLLAKSSTPVLVDGYPPLPVSVLSDKSELVVGRNVLRVSAHQPPTVTEFRESDPEESCATCTRPFAIGDEILRCSACQAPRHEGRLAASDEAPLFCGSYAVQCSRCGVRSGESLRAEGESSTSGGAPAPPPPPTAEENRSG
ncbi:MAG: hypothetical protein JRD03_04460 [Deltaproteobacteria bacterium]|nr:hypothetical protein [Deltaproteobacteria bacterium]